MDPRIETLKSTTFFGKRLTRRQIAGIQATVERFPALSRRELGHTICEHLGWFTPKGDDRIQPGLRLLEQLEALGIMSLPPTRQAMQRGPLGKTVWTSRSAAGPAIEGGLKPLTPLSLEVVTGKEAIEEWNEIVDRHHYLGYRRPFGPHLRYVILDRRGRRLGCLLFEASASSVPCRDEWIGWQDRTWKKHLNRVVCNSRFLIFPWVKVNCLASKALSMAVRRLADDWQAHHGVRPVLVETFVDRARFEATCYRAANWHDIGLTQGRKASAQVEGKTRKSVYVRPLVRHFKAVLLNGPRPAVRRRKAAEPPRLGGERGRGDRARPEPQVRPPRHRRAGAVALGRVRGASHRRPAAARHHDRLRGGGALSGLSPSRRPRRDCRCVPALVNPVAAAERRGDR